MRDDFKCWAADKESDVSGKLLIVDESNPNIIQVFEVIKIENLIFQLNIFAMCKDQMEVLL